MNDAPFLEDCSTTVATLWAKSNKVSNGDLKLAYHFDKRYLIVKDIDTDAGYRIIGEIENAEYLKHKEILDNVSNNIIPLSVVSTDGSSISKRESNEHGRPSVDYDSSGYGGKSGRIPQLDLQFTSGERGNSNDSRRYNAQSLTNREIRRLEELDRRYSNQINTRIPNRELLQRYDDEKAALVFRYSRGDDLKYVFK